LVKIYIRVTQSDSIKNMPERNDTQKYVEEIIAEMMGEA